MLGRGDTCSPRWCVEDPGCHLSSPAQGRAGPPSREPEGSTLSPLELALPSSCSSLGGRARRENVELLTQL